MTTSRLFRALLGHLRSEPLDAVRLVVNRVRHNPWWLLLKLDASIPEPARRRVYPIVARVGVLLRRVERVAAWGVLLSLVAAHGLGQREAVERHIAAARQARGRARLALGRLVVELGEPEEALAIVAGVPGPWADEVRARALEHIGHLRQAEQLLDEVATRTGDVLVRQRRDLLFDDLRALAPGFAPAPLRGATNEPVPGRILHLLNNSLPQKTAGYTIRAHRTMQAQREVGLDPRGLTKLGYPWAQGHLDADSVDVVDGISYHHVRFDQLRDHGTASRVERAVEAFGPVLEQLRPAVLHPTTPFDNAHVAHALREAYEVPVVYEVRGFLEDTWLSRQSGDAAETDRYQLHRAAEGRVAAAADHVVTLGEAMRADLITRGVAPERITVVPNAVDAVEFQPRGRDDALASGLGLEGAIVLGYVSSLVPYEGVEYLLEAVSLLRDRGHDVKALVVGDGPARPGLEQTATDLGIAAHVRFTGRVPHDKVTAYYELIDVFVVPRTGDRVCRMVTPLKPVEAMAMARCLVVSDNPALAETVEEGVTGFTFSAESAASLADVVEPLVVDPQVRRRVGANAREYVMEHRSWIANAHAYRDIYGALGAL